jgi:hypothetical protein
MGPIWDKATLEEKQRLLTIMFEAVYLDLAASRSVVGIQPKPVFYPLFKFLQNQTENKITIFCNDNGKKIEPAFNTDSSTVHGGDGGGFNSIRNNALLRLKTALTCPQ